MKKTFTLIAFIMVVIEPFEARSGELGRAVFQEEVLGSAFCSGRERIHFELEGGCLLSPVGLVCHECDLWPGIWLTSADVGTTLTATAATAPCFTTLVQSLTNDVREWCGVWEWIESYRRPGDEGCGSGINGLEDEVFSLDANDFHGATITSISVRLDSLSFETGSSPEMKDAYFSLTWIVEGTWTNTSIEPSTWGRIKALFGE